MIANPTIAGVKDAGPAGTCYRVLMWEASCLPEADLAAWKSRRAALLSRMRDAGIKGSRGLLRELESELCALTVNAVERPLSVLCGEGAPYTRAAGATRLRACLAEDPSVLAFRLGAAGEKLLWAEVLLQLDGEEGPDAAVQRWAGATPETAWCAAPLIQALGAQQAYDWQQDCRKDARILAVETAAEETAAQNSAGFHHVTVLAHEAVELLQPAAGRVLVDATLGGGGHTELMLQGGATVWGIDQDPAARHAAKVRLAAYGDRLHVLAGNFRNIKDLLQEKGVGEVDGLLADIGISSPQVDCAERGFSFLNEGPLDMRMNPAAPLCAADLIATAAEAELADILWTYGEEKASRAIARRIVQERGKAPITTTTQLADIIASVLPRKGKQHPATRSFQALRIAVNDELGALNALLQQGLELLSPGGRFAVITFHSLEDRAVKHFFRLVTQAEIDRPEWPAPRPNPAYAARLITRKPITAGPRELSANPRSRSAKLRVIEKI